jgi:aspartate/methionine/tyrosine aminotransferase
MFSSRVPGELQPNRLTVEIGAARAAGRPLIDLTLANPTAAGIPYPTAILDSLSDDMAARYEPRPLGLSSARDAVSRDYRRRGIDVAPNRIVLTASTSEAYSLLFKLLCEPFGEAVMVPVPSYPLFDHLTRLDGVEPVAYRLDYHGRWTVELDSFDARWTPRVRAVLAVSPNNPTGSTLSNAELRALAVRCRAGDAALIVDEVFADYLVEDAALDSDVRLKPDTTTARELAATRKAESDVRLKPDATGRAESDVRLKPDATRRAESDVRLTPDTTDELECLTFRLGGLSKSVGLPQVKLGWIAVSGPEPLVCDALERLELICDTYLSVSTPVQVAAPRLLEDGAVVRDRILERVRGNHAALREIASAYPSIELLHCGGGWSAVLRVPSTRSEEDLVLALLHEDGVVVHPGFFFDFPHEAFLVVSLLPEPPLFMDGIRRVMERAHV